MATRTYTGGAPTVAQVNTVTPGGTIAATDTFSIVIGSKTLTFTATTTTVAHVVTGLYNLAVAAALVEPEWAEVLAADNATALTLTANTPGKPFTQTSSINNVSGGPAPTLTTVVTTANSGPEQYDIATNWSAVTLPVNGDTVIVEGTFNLRYGDLSAVTVAQFILRDYSGEMGLPTLDAGGGYVQYRQRYFLMSSTLLDVFDNVSSSVMRFNVGTAQCKASIRSTGTSAADIKALTFLGTHASNAMHILGGDVGIATEAGEVATVNILRIGEGAGVVELGLGLTVSSAPEFNGGEIAIYCDLPGASFRNCTATLFDDADITATNIASVRDGATLFVNAGDATGAGGAGTYLIYGLSVEGGGVVDLTTDTRQIQIGNGGLTLKDGSTYTDPSHRTYFTGGLSIPGTLVNVDMDLGIGRSYTVTS